jgi:hypothetical protein
VIALRDILIGSEITVDYGHNVMQKKVRKNPQKDSENMFDGLDGVDGDISTAVSAHKSERPKRLKAR